MLYANLYKFIGRLLQPIPFDRETTCVRKPRWGIQN